MTKFREKLTPDQLEEMERQLTNYSTGVEDIIPREDLAEKIAKSIIQNKPLKVKLGLDPSAPDIHLGHTVVINKLKQFQENGHIIQLLIGDYTGKIGDPTGKSVARKQLTDEEVRRNAQTYFEQFSKVLDMDKIELHYNSKWLSILNFEDVLHLAGQITVARLLERDDFEERLAMSKPISLHEFFYPIMQGYDSVALESDIELGGTDQYFNILMGRHYQEKLGKEKQVAMLMPLLEGLDGVEKMSKSKNNYVGVDDKPTEMFGKLMSIPDELMIKYFTLVTDLTPEEVNDIQKGLEENSLHPRDAKMKLALLITETYHNKQEAENAKEQFNRVFQQKEIPTDIKEVKWEGELELPITQLIVDLQLLSSKGEVRRMVQNGGIKINQEKIENPTQMIKIKDNLIIQVGKRKFVKLIK